MGKPDTSKLLQEPPTEKSCAHAGDYHAKKFYADGLANWNAPRHPSEDKGASQCAREWYTCSFCGSMHPGDLAGAIQSGAMVHWADRKYGWPHKLYVDGAPNRYAGEMEIRTIGPYGRYSNPPAEEVAAGKWERFQDGFDERTGEPRYNWRNIGAREPASDTAHAKFYTVHLQDATPEQRKIIEHAMGMSFTFEGDRVKWQKFEE